VRRALLLVAGLLAFPAIAHAQQPGCFGETSAASVAVKPGPPLRFGITPGVQTGQLGTGPQPPRTPEDPARQLEALRRLVPAGVPFVLRLHRFFWSDGEAGVQRFLALADRYTRAGYLVELQLRYHPTPAQEGDIAAWTAFVRSVVDRFGGNRRVVAVQVTNEVNLPDSPDSSDGNYARGRDALIQGVIAAKDEARRRGFGQLAIGFNWAYRYTPQGDQSFWDYLRDNGGPQFLGALDWIGLDAYPGTFFPPANSPGGERDSLVNAMSSLRCFARGAGITDKVPIHVEENGWPTSPPARPYARQVQAMDAMVHAFSDFRGTYNVSDYRWFDLRDADSTSQNFQQQYGLMTDAYEEKPAFAAYRGLIAELSVRKPNPAPARKAPRLRLKTRCREGRWVVTARGRTAGVRRVDFTIDGRLAGRDRRPPFRLSVRSARRGIHRLVARVVASGGRAYRLTATLRACARTETLRAAAELSDQERQQIVRLHGQDAGQGLNGGY
jgi:hypothetical protein